MANPKKVFAALFVCFFASVFAAFVYLNESIAEVKEIQAPQLKVGSWWVIKTSFAGEVTRKLIEVKEDRFIVLEGKDKSVTTKEWNMIESKHFLGGIPLNFSPHSRTLSFPLWAGKEWGGTVRVGIFVNLLNKEFSVNYQTKAKAVAWETISVPAGEFEALKIEETLGSIFLTCWYAAAVEYFVKCISTDPVYSFELMRYHLEK